MRADTCPIFRPNARRPALICPTYDRRATGFNCKDALPPYTAVCNSKVSLSQWDGTNLVTKVVSYQATELIAGTELKPGP